MLSVFSLMVIVMENHFFSFPIILSLIIILICLILKVVKRSSNHHLPPGPWKLPLIGSIHHLRGSLAHHRMRELSQKYGPIMHLQFGETPTIVVSSPEIAKEVFKTHGTNFAHRIPPVGTEITTYGCTGVAFSPYGDYWRQLRKIYTPELLSAKRVRSFQLIREEEVSNLVRDISMNTGSSINLTQKLMSMTYGIVARAALGEKSKDQEAYISHVKEMMRLVESLGSASFFPSQKWLQAITGVTHKFKELHKTGDMILENIIRAATTKINDGDKSLLSVLLNLKHHDNNLEVHLTIDNIKALVQEVLIGGGGTTSTTLEWVFSEMLKNPRVLKKAQAEVREVFGSNGYAKEMTDFHELKFLKAVVKETLRLHPPGPLLIRKCGEICKINKYTIPAGTQMVANVWALGRDPKYWSEADKFYPERFLNCSTDYNGSYFEFIPFGAGKRMCPGVSFAQPSIEFPLAQLLYYFDWELPSGVSCENLDMTEALATSIRRKNELWAIPRSYNSVPNE